MLFAGFWRRTLGTARLAVLSQFEYRLNFATDAVIQPVFTATIEVIIWWAIFKGSGLTEINGYPTENYLAYALWAAFFARISVSWMYEYMMIDEIDSGRINAILTRPVSFYEFYFGQLMGYKLLCGGFSLLVPLAVTTFIPSPTILTRLPLAVLLVVTYLIFVHTMSYAISSLAFFYNRIHSIPAAKNMAIWMLSGELFPLDLVPDPYRSVLVKLPFANAVYVPVGYLTGRLGIQEVAQGFISIFISTVIVGIIGQALFSAGRRVYSGTGA